MDGSITFAGETYPTIKDVPENCVALRSDVETYCQWKTLYAAIDPKKKRRRRWHPPGA